MASRTQIICLHEGKKGRSTDPIFINRLIRTLKPSWIRQHPGNQFVRLVDCGGRTELIAQMPKELALCINRGADTTLMVWADIDDDTTDGDALKNKFWAEAERAGTSRDDFDQVVFAFAKDRIENWIEYLSKGATDESKEGPRVTDKDAADAARTLAERCQQKITEPPLPPSLEWSCRNWQKLVKRMKDS